MYRKMKGLVASVAAGALLCIVAVGHGATRSVELADVRVLSALFPRKLLCKAANNEPHSKTVRQRSVLAGSALLLCRAPAA